MNLRFIVTHPIVKWSLIFAGVTGLVKAAQFALFTSLAMSLPVDIYGAFGLFYAYQTAVTTFAATGIVEKTAGQLKDNSNNHDRRLLFKRNTGLFIVTGLLTLLIVAPLGFLNTSHEVSHTWFSLIPALMLGLVLAYTTLQGGLLRLDERYGASLIATAGVLFCTIAGMGLAAWFSPNSTLIFLFGLTGACMGLAFLVTIRGAYFGLPRIVNVGYELKTIMPFAVIGIFGWLSGYGMNTVINLMRDIESVAAFTFLLTISSLSQMISSAMNSVWVPRFYALYNAGLYEEAEQKNKRFYTAQALILAAVGVMVIFGISAVGDYFGKAAVYSNNKIELGFLFSTYILLVPWHQASPYYLVNNQGKRLMQNLLFSGIMGLAIWVTLIYFLGPFGIYVGFLVNALLNGGLVWIDAKRIWKLHSVWHYCFAFAVLILFFSGVIK